MFTLSEQVTSVTFPSTNAKNNKKNTINRRYRDARNGLVEHLGKEIETFSEEQGIKSSLQAVVDQRVPDNTESWGGMRCEDQDEDDDAGDAFLKIEEQQNL